MIAYYAIKLMNRFVATAAAHLSTATTLLSIRCVSYIEVRVDDDDQAKAT